MTRQYLAVRTVLFYSPNACNWGKVSGHLYAPPHRPETLSLSVQHSKRRSTRRKGELPTAMGLLMVSLYRFVQQQFFVLCLRPRAVAVKKNTLFRQFSMNICKSCGQSGGKQEVGEPLIVVSRETDGLAQLQDKQQTGQDKFVTRLRQEDKTRR